MGKPKKLPRQGRVSIPKRFPMRYQDEVWSLDWTIANFVLPRLRYFRECEGESDTEWTGKLDKMIDAFALAAKGAWLVCGPREAETVKEGLSLFAENFMSLWN